MLFTSSGAGLHGSTFSPIYATLKFGVVGLARSLARRYGREQIRFNVVCPGSTDTPLVRGIAALSDTPQRVLDACASAHAFHRLIRPEEVANVIVFLASDLASYVTGEAVKVDGGMMIACGGISFQDSMSKVTKD